MSELEAPRLADRLGSGAFAFTTRQVAVVCLGVNPVVSVLQPSRLTMASVMSIERAKEYFDVIWNKRQIDRYDECVAPNAVGHLETDDLRLDKSTQMNPRERFSAMYVAFPVILAASSDYIGGGRTFS